MPRVLQVDADGAATFAEMAGGLPASVESPPRFYVSVHVKALCLPHGWQQRGGGIAGQVHAVGKGGIGVTAGDEVYCYLPPAASASKVELPAVAPAAVAAGSGAAATASAATGAGVQTGSDGGPADPADASSATGAASEVDATHHRRRHPPLIGANIAEYVVLHCNLVAVKPHNLLFKEASAAVLAGVTAYECVAKPCVTDGQTALVLCNVVDATAFLVVQLCLHCVGDEGRVLVATREMPSTDGPAHDELDRYLRRHGSTSTGTTASTAGSSSLSGAAVRVPPPPPDAGGPLIDVLGCADLDMEQLLSVVQTATDGDAADCVFDLGGGGLKQVAWEAVRFGGHMVTIVEETQRVFSPVAAGFWGFASSPAFQRCVSVHFVHAAARALVGGADDWATYGQQLDALRGLFETATAHPPPYLSHGLLRKLDSSAIAEFLDGDASRRVRVVQV